MDIHQILRFNDKKKQQDWWTEDVDGDCIKFNLYRNPEKSIVLLKRWRGYFRKEEYCQTHQQCFYFEELTQNEWSIRKKQNNGRTYETKTDDREHHFDYCFEFDTNVKSRFVRLSFNRQSKLKKFPVVFITIYQKEHHKIVFFGSFSFHWLETEQIKKTFIEVSKFELSIKIKHIPDKNSHLSHWVSIVYVSYVRTIHLNWFIRKFQKHSLVLIYKVF